MRKNKWLEMFNYYIYPRIDVDKIDSPNPYVYNFETGLNGKMVLVNDYYNKIGVLDFFRNFLKTDIFIFNWIEELPSTRYGRMQSVFFVLFMFLLRLTKKKAVWVMHNIYSHNKGTYKKWSRFLFDFMMKRADLIITHSQGGIDFIRQYYPKQVDKARYFIHPVREKLFLPQKQTDPEFDFFIWGTIYPYKGVLEFLKFINSSPERGKFKILIVGACPDKEYRKKIENCLSDSVVYKNSYYKIEEIAEMAHQSRYVLFTYNSDSVLSSGTLMDTIGMGVHIIGPDKGAFRDLSDLPFIHLYRNYHDILRVHQTVTGHDDIQKEIHRFCIENAWEKFGVRVMKEVEGLFETYS